MVMQLSRACYYYNSMLVACKCEFTHAQHKLHNVGVTCHLVMIKTRITNKRSFRLGKRDNGRARNTSSRIHATKN